MQFHFFMLLFFHYKFQAVFSVRYVYTEYFFVDLLLNWFDAQQYCRQHYTDLVTISTMEDMGRLKTPSTYTDDTWIGMFDDPASWKRVMGNDSNSWRWSATGTTNPGGYQNWKSGEPDNYGAIGHCVFSIAGQWKDSACGNTYYFVCFTGSPLLGTKNYTLITTSKSWKDAQIYCRQHHTDLAMIEDETENAAVAALNPSANVWIGLYRVPWRWSDGSTSTFTNWAIYQPDNQGLNQHCVKVSSDQTWVDAFCIDRQFAFICEQTMERKRRHLFKIKFQAAVDLTDPSVSMLKQIQEHLQRMGLTDLNLKWKVLPQK